MGYKLKETEDFADGLKRIVLDQVDKALDNLKPTARNKDEAIHDARVCTKKIRSALRLISSSLGDKIYEEEDTTYRDAARLLSKVRDSAAMLEIIDKLIEHFSDQLYADAFAGVRAPLAHSKKVRQKDRSRSMTKAARLLRKARQRVEKWPDSGHRKALTIGLRRVFRKGRTNFAEAYKQPSVETFHEWRKQVKHLLYQTQILKQLWPNTMKGLAKEIKTLGQYLSEDHDLAILREKVSEQLEESEDRTEIEALVALVDQRRNELEISARLLGARIYAEKPRAFVARHHAYWKAWRSEVKNDPIVLG